MKKAQNLIETSVILCLAIAISLAVWQIINNQKLKLVNLSKTTETSGSNGRTIIKPTQIVLPPPEINDPPTQPKTNEESAY